MSGETGLDWTRRDSPREWSAQTNDLLACVYPMRDAPVSLAPTTDALTLKVQIFRRRDGGWWLLRTGYADTVDIAQAMAETLIADLLGRQA